MARYFTSDTHFGDHRVPNLYHRPFSSLAAMDEALIAAWNAACGPRRRVLTSGRFRPHRHTGRRDPAAAQWAKAPRGRKQRSWSRARPRLAVGAALDEADRKLVLSHYPFRSWNGQHRGAINLHGHSHGRMTPLPRQFDVGVDERDFRPVTLDQLMARSARP